MIARTITFAKLLLLTGLSLPAFANLTAAPDRMRIIVQEAAISTDDIHYITIFESPVAVELDRLSRPRFGGNEEVPVGIYKTLRLTITEIAWHATWSNDHPSSCDGATSGEAAGTVDLGGNKVFFFKTPELGGNTLAYYLAHPPLSGYVGDANHPFVLASLVKVINETVTTISLIIGVGDTLSCDGLSFFNRTENGNPLPQRTLAGPGTRLNGIEGIYLDTVNGEIGVTNSGNDSITIYSRTAIGDALPLRTLIGPDTLLNDPAGIYVDTVHNEIGVANRANDSVTIYPRTDSGNVKPLRSLTGIFTGLSDPAGVYLDSVNNEVVVANAENNSVTVYHRTASENALPLRTITGLSRPCGIYVDTKNNEIVVANSGNDTVTVYGRTASGAVTPLRTMGGDMTGLKSPCGVYVDTVNDEIFVANSGNNSITVYSRTASGNVAPIRRIEGDNTGINDPAGIFVDMDNNEIGVAHRERQVVMASLPPFLPSSSNGAASSSALAGDYNIVLYGADIKGVNAHGILIPVVFSERGTATFDSTTPWPRFTFRLDTQLARQVIEPDCTVNQDIGVNQNGFYDVNRDGSFYAFIPETEGSFQGVFLPDGKAFAASMIDSSNQLRVVYGLKNTGTMSAHLTSDGTLSGSAAHYAFTSYFNELTMRRPDENDNLKYRLDIGIAQTDALDLLGASTDGNHLVVENPMGQPTDPESGEPSFAYSLLLFPKSAYSSHPGGFMESPLLGFAGTVTADGGTLIFMGNTAEKDANGCNTKFGFGAALRQGTAGRFSIGDFKGTYVMAGFGDRFYPTTSTSPYRATLASITFDGLGRAEMTWFDNEEGMIFVDRASFSYQVNQRLIPGEPPFPSPIVEPIRLTVDVLDLFDRPESGPYFSALMNQDGKSLAFFRNLNPGVSTNQTRLLGLTNQTRLLGLALFQHP